MNNNKITVIIVARMGSSRFPGKTLADLHGKPMLERLVERLQCSKYVQNIIVATTDLEEDSAIEDWCTKNNFYCYRGSSKDVLGRMNEAGKYFNCSTIIEILGDNPLVHSSLVDAAVNLYRNNDLEYVGTLTKEYLKIDSMQKYFPIGIRVKVYSLGTLRKCNKLANSNYFREHGTSFIAKNLDKFRFGFIDASGKFSNCFRSDLTFAVNQKKNLDLIRRIYKKCYDFNPNFGIEKAIRAFDEHPKWHNLMGNK